VGAVAFAVLLAVLAGLGIMEVGLGRTVALYCH
jgi:hypothetical protein